MSIIKFFIDNLRLELQLELELLDFGTPLFFGRNYQLAFSILCVCCPMIWVIDVIHPITFFALSSGNVRCTIKSANHFKREQQDRIISSCSTLVRWRSKNRVKMFNIIESLSYWKTLFLTVHLPTYQPTRTITVLRGLKKANFWARQKSSLFVIQRTRTT